VSELYSFGNINSVHMSLFIVVNFLIMVLYGIWWLFTTFGGECSKYICKKNFSKKVSFRDEMITNNIYSLVHFKFLNREWEETKYELEKVTKMKDKQVPLVIDQKIFFAYVDSLEVRLANIKAHIIMRAKKDLPERDDIGLDFDFEELRGLCLDNMMKNKDM